MFEWDERYEHDGAERAEAPDDVKACGMPDPSIHLCPGCIEAYRNGIEPGETACEDPNENQGEWRPGEPIFTEEFQARLDAKSAEPPEDSYTVTLSLNVTAASQEDANDAAIAYGTILTNAGAESVEVRDVCREDELDES